MNKSNQTNERFALGVCALAFTIACLILASQTLFGLFFAVVVTGCLMAIIVSTSEHKHGLQRVVVSSGPQRESRAAREARMRASNRGGL